MSSTWVKREKTSSFFIRGSLIKDKRRVNREKEGRTKKFSKKGGKPKQKSPTGGMVKQKEKRCPARPATGRGIWDSWGKRNRGRGKISRCKKKKGHRSGVNEELN